MTDRVKLTAHKRKTPADATPFEREQLRFFLSGSDLAAMLSEVNPSLAWLPLLSEMKLIQNETQLIKWIERNFSDPDAVREVAANIQFFGPETAKFLEFRLNAQAADLSPLLLKSWTLITRHMRAAKRPCWNWLVRCCTIPQTRRLLNSCIRATRNCPASAAQDWDAPVFQ